MFRPHTGLLAALLAFAAPVSAAPLYTTVHQFSGGSDGSVPQSLVTDSTYLYLTTDGSYPSNGTVNRFDPATGQMALLHSFAPNNSSNNAPEGSLPGPLLLTGGKIYGLTAGGGPKNGGTVFSIDPASGAFQTVYAFDGNTNGDYPCSIVQFANALYVASYAGGPANAGTLVKIDLATGIGSVAYSFQNGADGAAPGDLVVDGTEIFGTALTGGMNFANGKLFSFEPASGTVTSRYTFTDGADGGYPSGMSLQNGTIYGFASGGTRSKIAVGFSFNPAENTEATWLTFRPGKDDCEIFTAPVAFGRLLLAGGYECGQGQTQPVSDGMVFTAQPYTGKMHALYHSAVSGEAPNGLIRFGSVYYGITNSSSTMGTIFKVSP